MKYFFALLLVPLVLGCSAHRIVTTWKIEHTLPAKYNKLMVISVFKTNNDTLKRSVENRFVKGLQNLNYNAVPAAAEFGPTGLEGLGEAETFLKLCQNGIDAVVTVALIDGTKESYQRPGYKFIRPASYYYNRFWSYKNIQADLTGIHHMDDGSPRFWEIIVYDLNKLEPVCVLQTKNYLDISDDKAISEFAHRILQRVVKERVMERKRKVTAEQRAF
jgi:hypothetical protein